jgi:hypothetical protein
VIGRAAHAAGLATLSLGLGFSASGDASNASGALAARLVCDPARAPGRVVCAVELSAPAEQRIAWADALILSTPAFARPLRSRVTARSDESSAIRLPLALVLDGPGSGLLRVRGRAVLCSRGSAHERCSPASQDAELNLVAVR